MPCAPIFGSPSPSTRAPCAFKVSRAARTSVFYATGLIERLGKYHKKAEAVITVVVDRLIGLLSLFVIALIMIVFNLLSGRRAL